MAAPAPWLQTSDRTGGCPAPPCPGWGRGTGGGHWKGPGPLDGKEEALAGGARAECCVAGPAAPHPEPEAGAGCSHHAESGHWGRGAGAESRAENPDFSEAPCRPRPRVLEVPYAYQCCAYGACTGVSEAPGQWEAEDAHPEDQEAPRRPLGLLAGQAESHCE